MEDPFAEVWNIVLVDKNETESIDDLWTYFHEKHYLNTNKNLNISLSLRFKLNFYHFAVTVIGIFAIVINLSVIISSGLLLKKGKKPRSTYILLGNLSLADFITTSVMVLGQLLPNDKRSHFTCSIIIGFIIATTITSVYSIALIAIERYIYILHGLTYWTIVNTKRTYILIILTWILGTILGILPILSWSNSTDDGKICWYVKLVPKEQILLTIFICCIPLLIISILYSIILKKALNKIIHLKKVGSLKLKNHIYPSAFGNDIINFSKYTDFKKKYLNKTMKNKSPNETFSKDNRQNISTVSLEKNEIDDSVMTKHITKWKAIKVVLFTSGAFIVTMVPYITGCIIYLTLCTKNDETKQCQTIKFLIASPLGILGFTNSLLNPIIYAWWHNGFRTSIRMMWLKRKQTNKTIKTINNNYKHNVKNMKTSNNINSDFIV